VAISEIKVSFLQMLISTLPEIRVQK